MVEIGYALSSEEHPPNDLVRFARRAEEAGFAFAVISDHYHPWTGRQGQASFIWSVLGGVAQVTERLRVGTAVTCPTMRYHPAVVAQAAATVAAMMPGRFFLGVGSGENLNEHILGEHWPETEIRLDRLEEAVAILRQLWEGHLYSHYGEFFTVENARLYTLPPEPPPIFMAAGGPRSADLAGEIADGLISNAPDRRAVQAFEGSGGGGKPCYGSLVVCWAEDEARARRTAHEVWPMTAMPGDILRELPLPEHFEQMAGLITEEQVARAIVCGPDPARHLEGIRRFEEAGFDHVYVHQVGRDQEGFFRFYEREVIPRLQGAKERG